VTHAPHLPSLAALRSFETAARHESFTLAAEELGLTQGAVSRQVRDLEAAIGARLFRRVGRAVRLTEAGRVFADDLGRDLGSLRQTVTRAVAAGDGARALSIAVLPTFGSRWLMPRLEDFRNRHPDIALSFISRTEPFDLGTVRCDLAIHFGPAEWPGAKLTPLCPEDLLAVAAPAFIARHTITGPGDLLGAPLLHLASRPGAWAAFRAHLGEADTGPLRGMQFDQFALITAAAVAGLGAALLPSYLIEAELDRGQLRRIARAPTGGASAYHLAEPLGAAKRETAQFVAWLRRQVPRRGA